MTQGVRTSSETARAEVHNNPEAWSLVPIVRSSQARHITPNIDGELFRIAHGRCALVASNEYSLSPPSCKVVSCGLNVDFTQAALEMKMRCVAGPIALNIVQSLAH